MPKDPKNIEVGLHVREIRERLGLSRPALAARIGISAVTLKNGELGITKLGGRTVRAIEQIGEGGLDIREQPGEYRVTGSPPAPADDLPAALAKSILDDGIVDKAVKVAAIMGCEAREALEMLLSAEIKKGKGS